MADSNTAPSLPSVSRNLYTSHGCDTGDQTEGKQDRDCRYEGESSPEGEINGS